MTQLDQISYPSKSCPERCIIWLHGLGADGHDFMPVAPMLNLDLGTEIIFPHAPKRAITINGGMQMRGWYDISDLALRGYDREGIAESSNAISAIYHAKIEQGIAAEDILFAGFSQGAAMALHCGLRNKCAGILALSGYLLNPEETAKADNDAPPIMMMHGSNDQVVAYALGQASRDKLRAMGYDVSWHDYPMGHEVNPTEIADIAAWLHSLGF